MILLHNPMHIMLLEIIWREEAVVPSQVRGDRPGVTSCDSPTESYFYRYEPFSSRQLYSQYISPILPSHSSPPTHLPVTDGF
jgi:hypothetical protein